MNLDELERLYGQATQGEWGVHRHAETAVVQASTQNTVASCGGFADNQRDPDDFLTNSAQTPAHKK